MSDVDIFLNHDSELSHVAECQRYAPLFSPLLLESDLADDCAWWLLDSGTSVTVLSKSSLVGLSMMLLGFIYIKLQFLLVVPWVRLHPHAGLDTKHDE